MGLFQLGEQSRKARERLAAGDPGDVISHLDMALILKCDCKGAQSKGYGIVNRALRWVEKEHLLVWRWDRETSCWHCLLDTDKPGDLDARRTRINRQAKRALVVSNTVDYDKLDDVGRARVAVSAVVAAAITRLTGPKISKRLLAVVRDPYIPEEDALLDACRKRLT